MPKKLLCLLLMMGLLICAQGAGAKSTETDIRLQALE